MSDLAEKITEALATIESQLDFSDEEDVSDLSVDKCKKMVGSLSASVESLLKNYQPYSAESKKKTVVLFGEPNVGKSSLFNALLGEGVAIVSSTPGTTRDVVRKRMFVDGIDVELEDTAGLRSQTSSDIEDMGIEMAKSAVEGADLVVYVFDSPGYQKHKQPDQRPQPHSLPFQSPYLLYQKMFEILNQPYLRAQHLYHQQTSFF